MPCIDVTIVLTPVILNLFQSWLGGRLCRSSLCGARNGLREGGRAPSPEDLKDIVLC